MFTSRFHLSSFVLLFTPFFYFNFFIGIVPFFLLYVLPLYISSFLYLQSPSNSDFFLRAFLVSLSLPRSKYSRPCSNYAPSILRSSLLLFFVPLSLTRAFLVLSCSRSQHLPFALYLSSLVPFPLICLYSRPTVASPLSDRLFLADAGVPLIYLFPSTFCTCMCNILLSSPFIIFSLRSSFSFRSLVALHRRQY